MDDDVVTIQSNDEAENVESKPLLILFKRLIGNTNKQTQNTVLTNAQILKILQDEFDVEINVLHELEVDIYLNIMKKFLKDWPQWDEFDRIINDLKSVNDDAGIKRVLDVKYKNLKEYLRTMLVAAEPIAKETVRSLPPEPAPSTSYQANNDSNDVVLEICCTRPQLNQLIFKHPIQEVDTIFNIEDVPGPSRISVLAPAFNSIMNWWCFSLHINLSCLTLKRETFFELKHFLVNKKLNIKTEIPPPNTNFQEKAGPKARTVEKTELIKLMMSIVLRLKPMSYKYVIETICNMLNKDLTEAPNTIKVPAMYRKCFNKYLYVRNLSTTPNTDKNFPENKKYDLTLEETVIPMYQLHILKIDQSKLDLIRSEFQEKIVIECKDCKVKFCGLEIMKDIQQHFLTYHQNEPDWQCRHCHKVFPMQQLCMRWWRHEC